MSEKPAADPSRTDSPAGLERPARHRLARFDALADGSLTRREHRGTAVLLCRVGERVHVVADRCTHEDVSLSLGSLCGHRLRCPLHGSAFDVRSGEALDEPAEEALETWPVAIEDGWVTIAEDEDHPIDERPGDRSSGPPDGPSSNGPSSSGPSSESPPPAGPPPGPFGDP